MIYIKLGDYNLNVKICLRDLKKLNGIYNLEGKNQIPVPLTRIRSFR